MIISSESYPKNLVRFFFKSNIGHYFAVSEQHIFKYYRQFGKLLFLNNVYNVSWNIYKLIMVMVFYTMFYNMMANAVNYNSWQNNFKKTYHISKCM